MVPPAAHFGQIESDFAEVLVVLEPSVRARLHIAVLAFSQPFEDGKKTIDHPAVVIHPHEGVISTLRRDSFG